MFNGKVNINGAKVKINRTLALMTRVPSAMNRGGLRFIGEIQEKYYSGRTGDDSGLNVRTGRLRDSWFPVLFNQSNDTVLQVNTDVKYSRIHEEGGEIRSKGRALAFKIGNQQIFAKKVEIPKRTDVIGEWERTGIEYLRDEVQGVLR